MKKISLLLVAGVIVCLSTVIASDSERQSRSASPSRPGGEGVVESPRVPTPKSPAPDPTGLREVSQTPVPSSSSSSDSGDGHCCHHHASVDGEEIALTVVNVLERSGGTLDRLDDDTEQVTTFLDGLNDEMHGLREEFNNSAASMRPHEFKVYLTRVCVDAIKAAQNGKVSVMTPVSLEALVRRVIDAHGVNKVGGMTSCKFKALLDERSSGKVGEMSQEALERLVTDTVSNLLARQQEAAEKARLAKEKATQDNLVRSARGRIAKETAEKEVAESLVRDAKAKEATYRAAHPWKTRAAACKDSVVCYCSRVPGFVQTVVAVVVTQLAMRAAGF